MTEREEYQLLMSRLRADERLTEAEEQRLIALGPTYGKPGDWDDYVNLSCRQVIQDDPVLIELMPHMRSPRKLN